MPNLDSIQPKNLRANPAEHGPDAPTAKYPATQGRQVNLLFSPERPQALPKPKRFLKLAFSIIIVAILILGGIVVGRAVNLSGKIFVGQKTSFFQKIQDLFRGGSGETRLIGENLGQINILLLGIGGEGHDGPYLTDTMILAELRPDTGAIALVSIPRDYWAQIPNSSSFDKINSAFSFGYVKDKNWDTAGLYARQAVEKLSGLTIPYFAVLDFKGFELAIDEVGGVDVNVQRTFTDYSFPNDLTNGYLPPITFQAGWQHMNGQRALEFARSRHAAGVEGSDFARSQRQELIIKAFKDKVLNLRLISDPGKINTLAGIFADHFHTNISPGELFRIYQLTGNNLKNFVSLSLDPSTNLICPKIMPDSGAYTLVPCEGKTDADVMNFFKNIFAIGKLYQEKSVIWLADGSAGKNLYQQAAAKLQSANLTVWQLSYGGPALPYNIFYQINPKPATAEFIKNTLNATEVSLPPPGIKIDKNKVDVIVILGQAPN